MSVFGDAVRTFKRDLIAQTLRAHGGVRGPAARTLGIQRTYLQRLITALQIDVPSPRAAAFHRRMECSCLACSSVRSSRTRSAG